MEKGSRQQTLLKSGTSHCPIGTDEDGPLLGIITEGGLRL